jgi:hypothetical protein
MPIGGHIFNLTVVAATPEFSGAAMHAALSGWRVSAVSARRPVRRSRSCHWRSARTGLTNNDRAWFRSGSYLKQGTRLSQSAAFAIPTSARSATCRATSIVGPGTRVVDSGSVRSFNFATNRTSRRVSMAFKRVQLVPSGRGQ